MPNYIQNKLTVISENKQMVKEFITFVKGEDTDFDLNKITPMPEILLDTTEGTDTYAGLYYYLEKNKLLEEYPQLIDKIFTPTSADINKKACNEINRLYEVGEHHFNAYKETGYVSWYKWCLDNWGTKWNTSDSSIYEDERGAIFFFTTAWDGIPMIVDKLHELFPNLKFEYLYADEDFTYNCGVGFTNENGEFEFRAIDNASDEAFSAYCECWNEDEEDFVKKDGYWMRIEDCEDYEDDEDEK